MVSSSGEELPANLVNVDLLHHVPQGIPRLRARFPIACKLTKKIAVSEIVLSHCRSSSAVHIEPMTSQQQPVSIA